MNLKKISALVLCGVIGVSVAGTELSFCEASEKVTSPMAATDNEQTFFKDYYKGKKQENEERFKEKKKQEYDEHLREHERQKAEEREKHEEGYKKEKRKLEESRPHAEKNEEHHNRSEREHHNRSEHHE